MISIRKLETVTLTAPLGLRFADVVTREFIGSGLSVLAYQAGNPSRQFYLVANRIGIYTLHHAPGLLEFERREAADVWQTPIPLKTFVIEVTDQERRFLPFQLKIDLPVCGVYRWISPLAGSLVGDEPGIPLYPAAARQFPAEMAVVRAELQDIAQGKQASGAVLEVRFNGRLLGRGIADETGRIVLSFPYPAPRATLFASPPGSPPSGGGKPLTSQEWILRLQAYYSPLQTSPPQPVKTEPPDLRATLSQQQAKLWDDAAMTIPLTEATLRYGRELILRSREGALASPASPPTQPSTLFITPA